MLEDAMMRKKMNFVQAVGSVLFQCLLLWGCNQQVEFAGSPINRRASPMLPQLPEAVPSPESEEALPEPGPIEEPAPSPTPEPTPDPVSFHSLEQTFPATRIGIMNLTFNSETKIVEQDIAVSIQPPTQETFIQVDRPTQTDVFHQGQSGNFIQETFPISATRLLDLLVVIDDSASMKEEQQELSSRFFPLISYLKDIDWRIAVVTTSDSCLRNGTVIQKGDLNAEELFKSAINAGTNGSATERGIKNAIRGLKGVCGDSVKSWVRENSTIGVLLVTDEDNCSSDYTIEQSSCKKDPKGGLGSHLTDYLATIRPTLIKDSPRVSGPAKARVYGLLWDKEDEMCRDTSGGEPKEYLKVISATQGTWGSICQKNYTPTLEKISKDVSALTTTETLLKEVPDKGTIRVMLDGELVDVNHIELSGNILRLKSVNLDTAKELYVTYNVGATPIYKKFPLFKKPALETVHTEVRVHDGGGAVVDPGPFFIDLTEPSITFETAPQDSSMILVTYREDVPLLASFSLMATDILAKTLSVQVNGIVSQDVIFDLASNVIFFASPPIDRAVINVSYQRLRDIVTDYQSVAGVETAKEISATDFETGDSLKFTLKNGVLSFPVADVIGRKTIRVMYNFGFEHQFSFAIPGDLILESLEFKTPGGASAPCGEDLLVEETSAKFSCSEDVPELFVDYDYVIERYNTFRLPENIPERAVWEVWVNGRWIEFFEVEDSQVILSDSLLGWDSIVRVKASWVLSP